MAEVSIEYLKTRFEAGDFPDQQDFTDLIDSTYNFNISSASDTFNFIDASNNLNTVTFSKGLLSSWTQSVTSSSLPDYTYVNSLFSDLSTSINNLSSFTVQEINTLDIVDVNLKSLIDTVSTNNLNSVQDINNVNTFLNANSSLWDYQGTDIKNLTGNWESTYNTFSSTSSNNASLDFVFSNFLPLSGGTITNNLQVNENVTIFGVLTAMGGTYFANTVYTTTSALSVAHFGSGPALYIGQTGTGDIASFYDEDQGLEILHVGGGNGDYPNVGIKTSTPNEALTVSGNISASGDIFSNGANLTDHITDYNNPHQVTFSQVSAAEGDINGIALKSHELYDEPNGSTALKFNDTILTFDGVEFDTGLGQAANFRQAISAAPINHTHSSSEISGLNFLPLSGGTISYDLTIQGNLTVQGSTTQIDTQIFSTSAVVIDTNSSQAALKVIQKGNGNVLEVLDSQDPDYNIFSIDKDGIINVNNDIKFSAIGNDGSFYFRPIGAGVEEYLITDYYGGDLVRYKGIYNDLSFRNNNIYITGQNKVGIGTTSPNEKFTVSGNISATEVVYVSGGNSNQWNSVYSTYQTNSAVYVKSDISTYSPSVSSLSNIVMLSQAEYDALPVKDIKTVFVII